MKCFILFCLILLAEARGDAQVPYIIPRELDEAYTGLDLSKLIRNVQEAGYGYGTDSANAALEAYLLKRSVAQPEMLRWNFKALDTSGLQILTSKDRKFRIYGWDQYTGGTMHFYSTIIQYETAPGKAAAVSLAETLTMEDGGDAGSWYDDVRTIKTRSGKTVYLAFYHGSGSSVDKTTGIEAFTISAGKLVRAYPFFYTKNAQHGSVSYYYSLKETTGFDYNNIPGIALSKDGKTLRVPVVTEEGKITRAVLIYAFDGEKFVYSPK